MQPFSPNSQNHNEITNSSNFVNVEVNGSEGEKANYGEESPAFGPSTLPAKSQGPVRRDRHIAGDWSH
jgi:hypothetical protein